MFLVVTKTVAIGGSVVTLYSIDNGKTWMSRPSDLSLFNERRRALQQTLQKLLTMVSDDIEQAF